MPASSAATPKVSEASSNARWTLSGAPPPLLPAFPHAAACEVTVAGSEEGETMLAGHTGLGLYLVCSAASCNVKVTTILCRWADVDAHSGSAGMMLC